MFHSNSSQVGRWLQMGTLIPYEIGGQCVFPVICTDGNISARYMAYVARRVEDFPEDGSLGSGNALSEDGKFARIELVGNRTYQKHEIDGILERIDRVLLPVQENN